MHACMITYGCIHACMDACINSCMNACMHGGRHTCMHESMHPCIYACIFKCMGACIDARIHACIHACMDAFMHSCINACIHVMHACMHASMTQKITSNLQDSTPASIKSARIESIKRGAYTKRLFLSFSSNAWSSKKPLKEEPQNKSISHRMKTAQEEFLEKKSSWIKTYPVWITARTLNKIPS